VAVNEPNVVNDKTGLPAWVPLIGLFIAFGMALFIGARICPVLSALVIPPNPRLPTGMINQVEHIQKGSGLDEFVYSIDQTGCEIAAFYEDWLHDCVYDPDISCGSKGSEHRFITPNQSYHVATCTGSQSIGVFSMNWTVYVASGYSNGPKTFFRVVREVGG
jgi:hypothetical protein